MEQEQQAKRQDILDIKEELSKDHKCFLLFKKALNLIMDLLVESQLEKQGEQKETPCERCRKAQPSHSCSDITALGRCYVEGEQKPTEWSEEDKKRVDQICEDLRCGMINFNAGKTVKGIHFEEIIESNIAWLKELEERVNLQPQQEWSEEDESRMENLCHFLKEYGNQYYGALTLEGTINWLKSLRPQSHWKPSEGQMVALRKVSEWSTISLSIAEPLISLYNDLKKLRGE